MYLNYFHVQYFPSKRKFLSFMWTVSVDLYFFIITHKNSDLADKQEIYYQRFSEKLSLFIFFERCFNTKKREKSGHSASIVYGLFDLPRWICFGIFYSSREVNMNWDDYSSFFLTYLCKGFGILEYEIHVC